MVSESYQTFTTGAVQLNWTPPASGHWLAATLNFTGGAAPTTAGSVDLIFKSKHGTAYDTKVYSVDPSSPASVSLYLSPDVPFPVNQGDTIQLTYPNPDNLEVAVTIKGDL